VQLIGNLGTDPEIVKFDNGRKLAKFSIATTETYYDNKGEKIQDTQWHSIVAWGKMAERSEKYLKKGSSVAVDGKIVYKKYEDNEGQKKFSTEIVMNEVVMLSKKDA
jgi:single-strand DNA-binding protein